MILSVAVLRATLTQEIRDKRLALTRNYIKNYSEGVPYGAELTTLNAQLERINGALPPGEICPRCYFMDGSQKTLESVNNSEPEKFVQLSCRVCGFMDYRQT